MAYRLLGAKSLPEHMPTYRQLDPYESLCDIWSKWIYFNSYKCILNVACSLDVLSMCLTYWDPEQLNT